MSGSDESDVPSHPVRSDYIKSIVDAAREKLTRYLPRAVEIISELAETSENDRVRLAAAQDIADRAGLGRTQVHQVEVSQSEHDIAKQDAEDMMVRIKANQDAAARGPIPISIDAVIVHEGTDD